LRFRGKKGDMGVEGAQCDAWGLRKCDMTVSPAATRICVVKASETLVTEDADRVAKASRGVPMKVPTACWRERHLY